MKFSDFVATDAIRSHVEADTKEGVIREMARALVDAGKIAASDEESIIKAILKREDLGGIGFESLDGEPVQLFFLLVSPPDRPGDHLRALESISRQLRDEAFCKLLKAAKQPVDIQHLLEEADSHGVVS